MHTKPAGAQAGAVEVQHANLGDLRHDVRGCVQQDIAAGNAVRQQAPKKRSAFQLRPRVHDYHSELLSFLHMKLTYTMRGK